MNRDQRWKSDDKENRVDKSGRKDTKRDKDRKQSDFPEFGDRDNEQLDETEKEEDRSKNRTGSVSSSQHSTNDTDGEPTAAISGDDGSIPTDTQRQDTEASSEADLGEKVFTSSDYVYHILSLMWFANI